MTELRAFVGFAMRNGWNTLSPSDYRKAHAVNRQTVRDNPTCAWCGRTAQRKDGTLDPKVLRDLDAHDIIPVRESPELALVPANKVTLCRSRDCHRVMGHFGDFQHGKNLLVKAHCEAAQLQRAETQKES